MADISKYEIVLNELSSLEAQVSGLLEKYDLLLNQKKELEYKVTGFSKENEYLLLQVSALENELQEIRGHTQGTSPLLPFSSTERESLKHKINDMIKKIDNHVSGS